MNAEFTALIEFAAASSLLTIMPGLDTALVIRTAAIEGRRSAMVAGLGICTGVLIWALMASTGLGVLFATSKLAYDAVRLTGAAYLLYLGVRLIVQRPPGSEPDRAPRPASATAGATAFRRGLFTNLLNPKVGLFYVSFLPQFIPAGAPVAAFSMLLASLHAGESLLWFLALSGATSLARRWLATGSARAAINRITGAVFIAIGFKLVLARR